jgi:hypothetical protein
MNPLHLENILKDALLFGSHSDTCSFGVAEKANRFLPSRHPKKVPAAVVKCDCWKAKALRMVRALSQVERSELSSESPESGQY